jgi:hypothetical protein
MYVYEFSYWTGRGRLTLQCFFTFPDSRPLRPLLRVWHRRAGSWELYCTLYGPITANFGNLEGQMYYIGISGNSQLRNLYEVRRNRPFHHSTNQAFSPIRSS